MLMHSPRRRSAIARIRNREGSHGSASPIDFLSQKRGTQKVDYRAVIKTQVVTMCNIALDLLNTQDMKSDVDAMIS